jgi:hypothetical protein
MEAVVLLYQVPEKTTGTQVGLRKNKLRMKHAWLLEEDEKARAGLKKPEII